MLSLYTTWYALPIKLQKSIISELGYLRDKVAVYLLDAKLYLSIHSVKQRLLKRLLNICHGALISLLLISQKMQISTIEMRVSRRF